MSAAPPILAVYDDDHAAGAVAGTDSPGAAGPARSIRGVVRRWMPRAGEPVADRRKGPRAAVPVALSFLRQWRRSAWRRASRTVTTRIGRGIDRVACFRRGMAIARVPMPC